VVYDSAKARVGFAPGGCSWNGKQEPWPIVVPLQINECKISLYGDASWNEIYIYRKN
jgi:hypothetical protein